MNRTPLGLCLCALFLAACSSGAVQESEAPAYVAMNLAAHPDDEDGATMNYYRRAKNAVVYSVIFTRGEGGQNEIGPDLYHVLGAIRTQETEAAARALGTQVAFLNFYDFGYSKTAEETFRAWGGRDHVTAELVRLIRKLKPQVLFTNHDTVTVGSRRQHGHHQAVGIAAYDAFALAADASFHPEQLLEDGIDLWQPDRMFLRHWRPQEGMAYDAVVPVGDRDPESRQSYAANAADALAHHASQGMNNFAMRLRGLHANVFSMLRSSGQVTLPMDDLFDGLTPANAPPIDITYRIDSGRIAPLPDGMLAVSERTVVPGQVVTLSCDAGDAPLRLVLQGAVDTTITVLPGDRGLARLRIAEHAAPTIPAETFQYAHTASHPPIVYTAFRDAGVEPIAAGYLPLEVAPPVYLKAEADDVRLRPGTNVIQVAVHVFDPEAERLHLTTTVRRQADGVNLVVREQEVAVLADGPVPLRVDLPGELAAGDYDVTVQAALAPVSRTLATTQITGRVFDVAVAPGLTVGVIASYDNTMEQALREMNATYILLDSLALARASYDTLHTIVLDIRSYLTRQDLRMYNDRLLEWVHRGGHLVVNYQKTFEWNADYVDPFDKNRQNSGTFAPYPLVLGRARVTREEAPVMVTDPHHVLLRQPNRIAPSAWEGWIQERGLYFPATWSDAYKELFCMQDPGDVQHCGSTLLAEYGDGTYLYTALVWYRQLKVYHPGAYALFANMISLPLTRGSGDQP